MLKPCPSYSQRPAQHVLDLLLRRRSLPLRCSRHTRHHRCPSSSSEASPIRGTRNTAALSYPDRSSGPAPTYPRTRRKSTPHKLAVLPPLTNPCSPCHTCASPGYACSSACRWSYCSRSGVPTPTTAQQTHGLHVSTLPAHVLARSRSAASSATGACRCLARR